MIICQICVRIMRAIIFIGIQASGKTSFFNLELKNKGFVHISMDVLRNRNKERQLVLECIAAQKDFVIDNTNPTRTDRKRYLSLLENSDYTVEGYFFQSRVQDCVMRNAKRDNPIPAKAIASTSNRLELPSYKEGFDTLSYISIAESGFSITDWEEQK